MDIKIFILIRSFILFIRICVIWFVKKNLDAGLQFFKMVDHLHFPILEFNALVKNIDLSTGCDI